MLLAGGTATRMGGAPKCLLEIDGVPLVRQQACALLDCGLWPVNVVLGHHGERVAAALHGLPVQQVHHPRFAEGQASSLRAGLASLPDGLSGVLVALADMPMIGQPEIAALLHAWSQRPDHADMLVPQPHGRPGNPVLFTPRVRLDLLQNQGDFGGRQWQAAHPESVWRWPTNNAHYQMDLDSPDDLEQFSAATGLTPRWPQTTPPPSEPIQQDH